MKYNDVSFLQVKLTAERILESGEKPTPDLMIPLLDDIGRPETICRYLHRWEKENKGRIEKKLIVSEDNFPSDDSKFSGAEGSGYREFKRAIALLRAIFESTADGLLIMDRQGNFMDWNKKFLEIVDFPIEILEQGNEEAAIGYLISQVKEPEKLIALAKRLAENPHEKGDIGEVYLHNGRIIERYTHPLVIGSDIVGRVFSFHDITKRKLLEEGQRLNSKAIEASTQGVVISLNDDVQTIVYVNPAFENITGYKFGEVEGKPLGILQGVDQQQSGLKLINLAFEKGREQRVELRSYRKNGDIFWNEMSVAPVYNENNKVSHFAIIVNDITEGKALREQLIHQATHDKLTNLPNRALLQDRISQAIALAKRIKSKVIIFFLDLDRFKNVNDSLGHRVGDLLLCEIAKRLKNVLRSTDTLGRLGGDEFTVLLAPIKGETERNAVSVANKILEEIRKVLIVQGYELRITASLGIACFPDDGKDVDTLIRHADTAMYIAKDKGRNTFCFFENDMNVQVVQRIKMETALAVGLEKHEFILHYQPIVNLQTGKVVSVEALCRWKHGKKGITISPVEFIPVAEEVGLIVPLGEELLWMACQQLVKWQNEGLPPLQVSVNVSSKQLQTGDFNDILLRVIEETHIDPAMLVLELTESSLLVLGDEMVDVIQRLKETGIQLSIDDFGTGYSSLNYIRQLPVDKIKIDRVFVRDMFMESDNKAIILTIIAMAKALKLEVIAEGAETKESVDFLRQHNCDEVQGFYFSKPLDPQLCSKYICENYGLLK